MTPCRLGLGNIRFSLPPSELWAQDGALGARGGEGGGAVLESHSCEGPVWWECWRAAGGRATGVGPASPKPCLLLHGQQRLERLQRRDGSVRGLPVPGCAPMQLSSNSGTCFTPSVSAGTRHHPPAHFLSTFPVGLATLPFAGEPGPVQQRGKAALPQADALPGHLSRAPTGLHHPVQAGKAPFLPFLS